MAAQQWGSKHGYLVMGPDYSPDQTPAWGSPYVTHGDVKYLKAAWEKPGSASVPPRLSCGGHIYGTGSAANSRAGSRQVSEAGSLASSYASARSIEQVPLDGSLSEMTARKRTHAAPVAPARPARMLYGVGKPYETGGLNTSFARAATITKPPAHERTVMPAALVNESLQTYQRKGVSDGGWGSACGTPTRQSIAGSVASATPTVPLFGGWH